MNSIPVAAKMGPSVLSGRGYLAIGLQDRLHEIPYLTEWKVTGERKKTQTPVSLSIVVTGRNDNYDRNFDERLIRACGRNLNALPEAELVFVEWNPIAGRPLVSEELRNHFADRVRCVVVDSSYRHLGGRQEFAEFPAKNVGIRRARGEFILVTNSDIIFSPEVCQSLSGPLDPQVCYRAERYDIKPDYINVVFPLPGDQVIRRCGREAQGDFMLLDRATWFRATGYAEAFPNQRIP